MVDRGICPCTMPPRSELGTKLLTLRRERGLTQVQLADMSGVSRSRISELEGGIDTNPTLQTGKKLAAALKVRLHDLLGIG